MTSTFPEPHPGAEDKPLRDRIAAQEPVRLGGHAPDAPDARDHLLEERDALARRGEFLQSQLAARDTTIAALNAQLNEAARELIGYRQALAPLHSELAERDARDVAAEAVAPGAGGRWERIAFMGHVEYAGWVTEVTRNGQPAYRIELPDYLWGDDKSAWVEHSASSWYSSNPVNARALRQAWEAKRRRHAEIAEWEARQMAPALPAGDDQDNEDVTNRDVDPDACDAVDRNDFDAEEPF